MEASALAGNGKAGSPYLDARGTYYLVAVKEVNLTYHNMDT